jgi:hypothetical protein
VSPGIASALLTFDKTELAFTFPLVSEPLPFKVFFINEAKAASLVGEVLVTGVEDVTCVATLGVPELVIVGGTCPVMFGFMLAGEPRIYHILVAAP